MRSERPRDGAANQSDGGFLVEGAIAWSATPLTTERLFASTVTAESPLLLVSGVLTGLVSKYYDVREAGHANK
jgi:hypothetical protein